MWYFKCCTGFTEIIPIFPSTERSLKEQVKGDQALTSQHELIGIVRDGEDVWRGLLALFASVGQHHLRVVHRQPLVGVDGDTEETRVGLQGRETARWLLLSLAQQAFQLPKGRQLLVLT